MRQLDPKVRPNEVNGQPGVQPVAAAVFSDDRSHALPALRDEPNLGAVPIEIEKLYLIAQSNVAHGTNLADSKALHGQSLKESPETLKETSGSVNQGLALAAALDRYFAWQEHQLFLKEQRRVERIKKTVRTSVLQTFRTYAERIIANCPQPATAACHTVCRRSSLLTSTIDSGLASVQMRLIGLLMGTCLWVVGCRTS